MHSRRETVRSGKPVNHNVRQRVGSGTECTGASRFKNQVGCLQRTNEPTDQLTNQITNNQQNRQDQTCFSATLSYLISVHIACQLRRRPPPPPPPLEIVCLLKPTTKTTISLSGNVFFSGKKCANCLSLLTQHKHL